jgi:hydroxymethylglutaryl-CoA lyase
MGKNKSHTRGHKEVTMNALPRFPDYVSIREVGPRDGLQNEDVILTTTQKVQLIDRLADTGLTLIEVVRLLPVKQACVSRR